jgi:hypothetical protein
MYYFYGFTSAFGVYIVLNYFFPAKDTHVPYLITGEEIVTQSEAVVLDDHPEKVEATKTSSEKATGDNYDDH